MKNVVTKFSKFQNKCKTPLLKQMFFEHGSKFVFGYSNEKHFLSMQLPDSVVVIGSGGLNTADLKDLMKVRGLDIISIKFVEDKPTKIETNKGDFTFAYLKECEVNEAIKDMASKNMFDKRKAFESELLQGMVKYVSKDETQPFLNHIWHVDGTLYSSHKQALRYKKLGGYADFGNFTFHTDFVNLLDAKTKYSFHIVENVSVLYGEDGSIMAWPTIDVKASAFANIFPENGTETASVKIEVKPLAESVELASMVRPKVFKLELEKRFLTISAEDVDFEKTFKNSLQQIESKGEITIGLDPKLFLQILKDCDKEVKIKFWNPDRVIILNDEFLLIPVEL